MEKKKDLFAICGRKSFLKSRSKENDQIRFSSERHTTFRSAARQVWIANSFSKQQGGTGLYLKTSEDNLEKTNNNTLESLASPISHPQNIKRKGTPEIFPMSSEMRKTLVLLGNLDLVPEDERQNQETKDKDERQKKIKSFRQRTQMRVIQPQRFLRSFRSVAKKVSEKSLEENVKASRCDDDIIDESLINSRTSNNKSTLCAASDGKERNKNDTMKLESLGVENDGNECIESKSNLVKKELSTLSLPVRELKRNNKKSWRKSIQKHQHGQVLPSPSNPFFLKKHLQSPTRSRRKVHLSKSWQSSTDLPKRFPIVKRAFSLSSSKAFSSDTIELSEYTIDYSALKDGKSIDEITSDIQERCSKWFEFRQKIRKPYEYK